MTRPAPRWMADAERYKAALGELVNDTERWDTLQRVVEALPPKAGAGHVYGLMAVAAMSNDDGEALEHDVIGFMQWASANVTQDDIDAAAAQLASMG